MAKVLVCLEKKCRKWESGCCGRWLLLLNSNLASFRFSHHTCYKDQPISLLLLIYFLTASFCLSSYYNNIVNRISVFFLLPTSFINGSPYLVRFCYLSSLTLFLCPHFCFFMFLYCNCWYFVIYLFIYLVGARILR